MYAFSKQPFKYITIIYTNIQFIDSKGTTTLARSTVVSRIEPEPELFRQQVMWKSCSPKCQIYVYLYVWLYIAHASFLLHAQ